ncbi:MAG: hypothetical protein KDE53_19315, partial [Caldilineaceae bacterium]|nr:hypothetical protein [Caldilineaceae bacterium]
MKQSRRRNQKIQSVLSLLIALSLVIGPGLQLAQAEVLSGAAAVTLAREPQQTPDGLGSASFAGLQYADPAAQIDLVQPPVANNQGSADLSHPLSVPPGRAGLQPNLALTYNSGGGHSWVGHGWDLAVGAVTIDTRWGVPRYNDDKESETYVLDGEVLAPTAVRSELLDRQAERVFTRRIEGEFERIVRHGDGPGAYWWEVTDKSATHRYYGGTPETGRDASAILADDSGNEFVWALKQVRDVSDNTMNFSYVTATGEGVGAAQESLGCELYLSAIDYTGSVADGVTDDPAYRVDFVRASQLNEPHRTDIEINARGGFLRVTSDLLRQVNVTYRGTLARRYVLNYREGAFAKTLLDNVTQAGTDGVPFATHSFDYYDDVRTDGSTYAGFADSETWDTKDDNIGLAGFLDKIPEVNAAASALGGAESVGGDLRA